ncbi:hypothetical protein SeMB42_g06187 [Synchytrium endobioticum]|uniref:SET domain-containing protein n=1 Tax=Synchytrium endobioticum TaxID=286115 RepID=A0A507D5Y0_9FUNG|nr:hypothetical protein SeMB42_g06187 [Synchytrium endobioticum]TPX46873.1 hypothetical protein SeLEV6574_g02960 [Synchytrium endobioticum]
MQFDTWLKKKGLQSVNIEAANFADTGRGVKALYDIPAHSILVKVPSNLILTRDVVEQFHPGASSLTEHQALALFLASHKHDTANFWFPFINVLPQNFGTMAMFLAKEVRMLLQPETQADIERQEHKMELDINAMMTKATSTHARALSRTDLIWAWCAVNTRCLTLHTSTTKSRPMNRPNIAMMPFLDFLNHSHHASIEAGLDSEGSYVIKILHPVAAQHQVFINYGPHDNAFLLREYGFTMSDNLYDNARLDNGYEKFRLTNEGIDDLRKTNEYLECEGYKGDYAVSVSHPISYRLLVSLRLRCLIAAEPLLHPRHHRAWRKTLFGETEMINLANEHEAITAMSLIAIKAKDDVMKCLIQASTDERSALIRPILESTRLALNACIDACGHYFD